MIARAEQLMWNEYRVRRMGPEEALELLIAAIRRELGLPEFKVALCGHPESPSESDDSSERPLP
jgi:hypothetical protein